MKAFVIIFSGTCFLLFSGACHRECRDIACVNGGSCDNGLCNCPFRYGGLYCDSLCPVGYEGVACNIEVRQQFLRQWSATITSTAGATVQQQLNITAGTSVTYINVSNFDNQGFNFIGIIATANSFSFANQPASGSYTGTVSGSGVLNGTNLLINVTRQDGISYVADCNP